MKNILFFLAFIPSLSFAQPMSITSASESEKTMDGRYVVKYNHYTNASLLTSTVTISEDLSTLNISFYDDTFRRSKSAIENGQQKIFYQSGSKVVILNMANWTVSYWDGSVDENLSKHFFHYYLKSND